MSNVLTRDRIEALPEGQPFHIPPGTLVTSAARECAAARRVELIECADAPPLGGGPSATTCAPGPFQGTEPPSQNRSTRVREPASPAPANWVDQVQNQRKGGDPAVWRQAAGQPSGGGGLAPAPKTPSLDYSRLSAPSTDRSHFIVVTAVGRNRPRILAELTAAIADVGGDIREISQRIVEDFFHAILTVDAGNLSVSFQEAKERVEGLSREMGYQVQVQHEKVFKYMHRI